MLYADDADIMSQPPGSLVNMVDVVVKACSALGLTVCVRS